MDQKSTTTSEKTSTTIPVAEAPKQEATTSSTPPAEPSPSGSRFPIKTLLLIIILVAITGGLIYLALPKSKNNSQSMIHPTPTISPAHTVLSLTQGTATGSGSVLTVVADTGVNKITGVQLEIAYDPSVVSNVVVTAGDFLTHPTVLLNLVDTKNGRISYAAVLSPTAAAISGKGNVATISYTLAPATVAMKETTFKFLPKSKVTEDNELDSVLKNAKDLTLPLPGADKLPTNSPH